MQSFYLFSFCLCFSFMACKKTIDSETKRWSSNQATLKRLMSEYPNFKPALEFQLAEASKIYQSAGEIADQEAKIARMNQANNAARPYFVNQLDKMDEKIEDLREAVVDLIGEGGQSGLMIAGIKYNNAESAIAEAKSYISAVSADDKMVAEQVVKKAVGKIDRMKKTIDDRIRNKKREAAKLKKATEVTAEEEAVETAN